MTGGNPPSPSMDRQDAVPASTSTRWLVTICTYNERENLPRLIPEIFRHTADVDILVVDDNSPDGTGALADDFANADPRVKVLHRPGKQGLGTAILAGLQYGIDHGYDYVINLDADFSHDPKYLPALRDCMNIADVGIGSRYVAGGGVVGWSRWRKFMSGGINWYARKLLGLRVRDASGAFRCYRLSKIRELDFRKFRGRGYSFQEEVLFRCARVWCSFAETPIIFEDRRAGTSKINWKESVGALWIIFRLWIDRFFGVSVR